jgi:hypothetical protein
MYSMGLDGWAGIIDIIFEAASSRDGFFHGRHRAT